MLAPSQASALGASAMGVFKNLFTWWDGATLGTALFSWKNGRKVGSDALGNHYFESKKAGGRRWVMYTGSNDVSRVPPEWYAWLTRQIDGLPDEALPPPARFHKAATPNLTGTPAAYRPTGALEKGGRRQAASGDYQAWTPD
jgi:NADH:ubiquinone oxidoreductase subunit